MLMVTVCVLYLAAIQAEVEVISCPAVCICPNKTMAICDNKKISDINFHREKKFDNSLEELHFSGNKLRVLSDDTFNKWNVKNVRVLDLSDNLIENITEYAFQVFGELLDLDLSRNKIYSIHSGAFDRSPKLVLLSLARNRLTEIGEHTFSQLLHLQQLDLSHNNISSIQPDTFHNNSTLEWLSLASNGLIEIRQHAFSHLSHLQHLDLSHNIIYSIQSDTFHNNSALEWLSLASNGLSEIRQHTVSQLSHLQQLDLSNNNITRIDEGTFSDSGDLEWLSLANNKITTIDSYTFQKQSKLLYVDLSGNLIAKIEGRSFMNLKVLKNLSLARNRILDINEVTIDGLHSLEYMDLSSNNIRNINLSVFYKVLQKTIDASETSCVFNTKHLTLSTDSILSSNLLGTPHNPIIFCNLTLLVLSENCLSLFDETFLDVLNTSGTFINLTNNPCSYGCSSSEEEYKIITDTSLKCASGRDFRITECNISEHNGCIATLGSADKTDVDMNEVNYDNATVASVSRDDEGMKVDENKGTQPFLPAHIFIFLVYTSSVFVAIIVVLVITHVIGKPELDEFWWEDKLEKRNYC